MGSGNRGSDVHSIVQKIDQKPLYGTELGFQFRLYIKFLRTSGSGYTVGSCNILVKSNVPSFSHFPQFTFTRENAKDSVFYFRASTKAIKKNLFSFFSKYAMGEKGTKVRALERRGEMIEVED
jgi:hypothetical protein